MTNIFASPFRIFFMSCSLWAVLAIPIWIGALNGYVSFPGKVIPLVWHQQEMIFGFMNAAIAGFFLTAVCVWTSTKPLRGGLLVGLWLVWLLGRFAIFGGDELYLLMNLLFFPLVIADGGRRIIKVKQKRQYPLLALLVLLYLSQTLILFEPSTGLVQSNLLLIAILALLIGGRITPAFSTNWAKRSGLNKVNVKTFPLIEKLTWLSTIALFVSVQFELNYVIPYIAISAAGVCLIRVIGWNGWAFYAEPLLWILHLSLLWVSVAFLFLSLGYFEIVNAKAWVHALTIGAIGSLILGVITRVPLGHTGRPLVLPKFMAFGYWFIQAAAFFRVATASNWVPWHLGITLSTILWTLSFVLYLYLYLPILLAPRVDGAPG